jgi:hypothetical protein
MLKEGRWPAEWFGGIEFVAAGSLWPLGLKALLLQVISQVQTGLTYMAGLCR